MMVEMVGMVGMMIVVEMVELKRPKGLSGVDRMIEIGKVRMGTEGAVWGCMGLLSNGNRRGWIGLYGASRMIETGEVCGMRITRPHKLIQAYLS
jgi:hypothetical protein